jgi:tetratricopeptide (TPR) repeat protein
MTKKKIFLFFFFKINFFCFGDAVCSNTSIEYFNFHKYLNNFFEKINTENSFFFINSFIIHNLKNFDKEFFFLKKTNEIFFLDIVINKFLKKNFENQDYEIFIKILDKFSKQKLQNFYFEKAYSFLILEKFEDAYEILKENLNTPQDYYYFCYLSFFKKDFDKIIENLEKIYPDSLYKEAADNLMLHCLYQQNKFENLEKKIKDLSVENSNFEDLKIIDAESKYFNHKYEDAIVSYQDYLKNFPNNLNYDLVVYRIGHSFYLKDNFDMALEFFKKINLEKSIVTQLACFYIGIIQLKKNEINSALETFEIAKNQKFDEKISARASFEQIKINFSLENYEKVLELCFFHKLKFQNSYKEEIDFFLEKSCFLSKDINLILKILDENFLDEKLENLYDELIFLKSEYLFLEKNLEKSLEYLKKKKKNKIKFLFLESIIYLNQKKYFQARESLDKIISSKFSQRIVDLAYYNLAYIDMYEKKYEEALKKFQILSKSKELEDSIKEDINFNIGNCFFYLKKINEALEFYKKYEGCHKYLSDFYSGIIFFIKKDIEKAKIFFQKVLENKDKNQAFYKTVLIYSSLLQEQKDYQNSISVLDMVDENLDEKIIEDIILQKANCFFKLKKYENSIFLYKKILEKSIDERNKKEAYIGIKNVFIELGKVEDLELFLKNNKYNLESESLEYSFLNSAKLFFYDQKYQHCIDILKKIENVSDKEFTDDLNFFLAESYNALNEFENANFFYEKIIYSKYSLKVCIRLCNNFFSMNNFDKCEFFCKKILEEANDDKTKNFAYEKLITINFNKNDFKKTKFYADKILSQKFINTKTLNEVYLILAKVYFLEKDLKSSVKYLNQISKENNDDILVQISFLEGSILFLQKKYDLALKKFYHINNKFYKFEKFKNESYLMIAKILLEKEDFFQAQASVESIIENVKDEIILEQANVILSKILEKKTLQKNENIS